MYKILVFFFFIFGRSVANKIPDSIAQDIGTTTVAPSRADGKALYIHCARCHKPTGIGGPSYGGYAANLRETMLDHEELVMVITEGRRTLGMPEFKSSLSKREISALATFIEDEFNASDN